MGVNMAAWPCGCSPAGLPACVPLHVAPASPAPLAHLQLKAWPLLFPATPPAVGITPYTFDATVIACQEDPAVGLAAQLQAQQALSSHSVAGRPPAWVIATAAAAAAAAAGLAGLTGLVLWRRRQRRRRRAEAEAAAASAPAAERSQPGASKQQSPITPRTATMGRMESGDLAELDCKLQFVAAGSGLGKESGSSSQGSSDAASTDSGLSAVSASKLAALTSASEGSEGEGEPRGTAAQRLKARGRQPDALWRTRRASGQHSGLKDGTAFQSWAEDAGGFGHGASAPSSTWPAGPYHALQSCVLPPAFLH